MKNFLIGALLVAVLCLGGYIVYDKIISDNNKNNTGENTDNKETVNNVISDEEAYSIGKNLHDYGTSAAFGSEYKIVSGQNLKCEITNYEEVSSKFTKNNLVSSVVNEDVFRRFDYMLEKENGKYYGACTPGRGSSQTYISTKLQLVKKEENRIVFDAVSSYCVNGDNISGNCNGEQYKTYEFIIEKENNEWKIAKVTIPF